MSVTIRSASSVLLGCLALLSCSGAPDDGASCPDAWCTGHGTCTEANSLPTCACAEGYTGLICGECVPGFHRLGNSLCLKDQVCSDTTCGLNGKCSVVNGQTSCACSPGYDGAACEQCAAGYQPRDPLPAPPDAGTPEEPDAGTSADAGTEPPGPIQIVTCIPLQVCAPTSCPPGFACNDASGIVQCSCASSTCSACNDGLCGAHGTCDETSGVARCTCETGYVGADCTTCYIGYAPRPGGICAAGQRCSANTCSGRGSCDASSGLVECDCDAGATGDFCESCATGYHLNGLGACVADAACGTNSCPANATCEVNAGVLVCACKLGYSGDTCASCYPGFHRESGKCVLDTRCTGTSCGKGSCEDATGGVVCTCPSGFTGAHCEINTADCGTSCQTGVCVQLATSRACLCSDKTWGNTCPPGPAITAITPPTADLRGGTSVTITGTGFEPSSVVTLDGVTVTGVSYLGPTSLRFNTPASTTIGSKSLTITNANRQLWTSKFTYTPVVFTLTKSNQTFTVPAGVTALKVTVWGAGGGAGRGERVPGGAGGRAAGTLPVTSGSTLTIVVGEGGARVSGPTASGAGGGYSGVFSAAPTQATALLVAGGGGGGGFFGDDATGSAGGNGGGDFGADANAPGTDAADSQGLGGSTEAGGIGGCLATAQCGQNGLALLGGGGGLPNLTFTRSGMTFGGGGGVGASSSFTSAGGGGGYFGGGGGANGGGHGGGGGSGFLASTVADGVSARSTVPGVPEGQTDIGYVPGTAFGGAAKSTSVTTGGNGLVLVSW